MFILKGKNDLLYLASGRKVIDLFSAHGAVSLGHQHPAVVRALRKQAGKIWLTGGWPLSIRKSLPGLLMSFFPKNYKLGMLYSTGMEAVEFALRAAKVYTGRRGIISFSGNMHGKSSLTACLGWKNIWQDTSRDIYRLPSLREASPAEITDKIKKLVQNNKIAAVIFEPLQCSNGGLIMPDNFYRKLIPICHKYGVLIIFDEIMTGFYRTGSLFYFIKLNFTPDIILLGKSLGNGFPVSAVVMRKDIKIVKEMLPRSTFADNPLAAAVVTAVLKQYLKPGWEKKTCRIEKIVKAELGPLVERGCELRGSGACWILTLPEYPKIPDLGKYFFRRGLAVNQIGRYIRILPPLTIKQKDLKEACLILSNVLNKIL